MTSSRIQEARRRPVPPASVTPAYPPAPGAEPVEEQVVLKGEDLAAWRQYLAMHDSLHILLTMWGMRGDPAQAAEKAWKEIWFRREPHEQDLIALNLTIFCTSIMHRLDDPTAALRDFAEDLLPRELRRPRPPVATVEPITKAS
ncbi:hypothetical protein [Nonomuraea sp. NPDC023979]|uniref:hypothetical protein n=1 Tax=Nonomuraea sp. NPDC023979 TaxID=3154796 RepID=UPI0033D869CE